MADQDPPEVPEDPAQAGTPTPEPGPTPTPQEPELKSAAELLGTGDPPEAKSEPGATPAPGKPKSDAAARIQVLTAEKWEEKRAREVADARAQLAEQTLAELARLDPSVAATLGREVPPAQSTGDQSRPAARTYTQAEVLALAQQTAANTVFNQQVDQAVLAGRAAHADYDASIAELRKLTGPEMPVTFVQAALETGELTEIVYSLGKNPSEADRILSLPPLKQAVALARYADGLRGARKTPEPSKAPEAIAPKVTGRAMTEMELDDPKLPLQEFIRRRNEMERKARQRA